MAKRAGLGLDIVIGRKKQLPEGAEAGDNLILMGDCLKGLSKKIGGDCLFVPGCPPVEAFPYWTIVDREEQPGMNATRERHEAEEKIFKEKLYGEG
jgi:hypothetical protein